MSEMQSCLYGDQTLRLQRIAGREPFGSSVGVDPGVIVRNKPDPVAGKLEG